MNTLEVRGKLPPGVAEPREGYRETEVYFIEGCNVYDNDYPTGAGESEALDYLSGVNASLSEQAQEERKRISALRLQMRRERRQQAKREREAEYFDWVMVVLVCAMIAAVVMM